MFERLIRLVVRRPGWVLLAVLAMGGLGVHSALRLPVDAVADISTVQVVVNTAAPGYSPFETEQRVTFPIETGLAGLPGLEHTRSLSRYGLSQVVATFRDGTDVQFARQLVNQRLQESRDRLPAGLTPLMGPVATGLGEIYLWTVETDDAARMPDGSRWMPADLRELQDWVIRPQLRTVPGVADVNSIGGHEKQIVVAPDLERLGAHDLTVADLADALARNNVNLGAGYVERNGAQILVRAPGQVASLDDVGAILVRTTAGEPVRVRDVARVAFGGALRTGAATADGRETVLGTAFMRLGENSRTVSRAVDRRLAEVNRTLPDGVRAVTVYDRTHLVDRAIATVRDNLLEGALLVIAVLFAFLGNLRASLVTAAIIPLAMLFTFTGMATAGISASLMSLGALDFGLVVDGGLVIVENAIRRFADARARHGRPLSREERIDEVIAAARETRRPLIYGQLVIMVVYVPVLALAGVEGKMFHPMAWTVLLALFGALLLSVTFVPAAIALFVRDDATHRENRVMAWAKRRYAPLLAASFAHAPVVVTGAGVAVLLAVVVASRLGSEFVPNLDEGDLAIQALRVPGTSLTQSVTMQRQLEAHLKARFPEIERVFARTGTAEIASDPMPPNVSDGYVMLKPERDWPQPRRSREALVAAIRDEAARVPGSAYEFSQPIQLRFNELLSGVRSDVAVKLFGDEPAALARTADAVAAVLARVPGAADVKVEQTTGLPMLTVDVDRDRAARLGLSTGEVQDAVATAVGGREAGTFFEHDRRFAIVVRLPESVRQDLDALGRLPIALPKAEGVPQAYVPLGELATLAIAPGPNQVSREDGRRRVVVSANVRGRDLGSFVAEAQRRVKAVRLPTGAWIAWGGTFEQLESATARLRVVVPLALAAVFVLLFAVFGNVKDGLLVFTGIPFALTGGVLALWLRGMPLSITAAVGFIALSGVAVLNGLVMLSFVRDLRERGRSLEDAITEGALVRLRPVLMTALVASLGFVPMALATGTGAEVQRPLATVVIGGILSSTALTLLVLPVLYRWAHRPRRSDGVAMPVPAKA